MKPLKNYKQTTTCCDDAYNLFSRCGGERNVNKPGRLRISTKIARLTKSNTRFNETNLEHLSSEDTNHQLAYEFSINHSKLTLNRRVRVSIFLPQSHYEIKTNDVRWWWCGERTKYICIYTFIAYMTTNLWVLLKNIFTFVLFIVIN